MPSLYLRKDSPYWVIAYTDARGRRLKKSSKTTDYEEARKIAQEWEEAIRGEKKKRVLAKQYQTVLREIQEQPQTPRATFSNSQIAPDHVPNQREIARMLRISQATVSMALRGDRSISQEMRRRVQDAAAQQGYHSNAYVNVLMSRIRSGKKLNEKGGIAMLVDAPSLENWHLVESYRAFHSGVIRRSRELGFHVETFFLRAPNMDVVKIERILRTRGIQGVILAPPYRGNRSLKLFWENYAAVGVGFGWEEQDLDRVVFDSLNNYITAFNALLRLGYQRIGTVMGEPFTVGTCLGIKWFTGFLDCQSRLLRGNRIPICRIPVPEDLVVTPSLEAIRRRMFREWLEKWRPDALLTITGFEGEWLKSMGIRYPEDIGFACLTQPVNPEFATIDEKGEEVGATASELVASKIARNEYGPPRHPKVTMIEGTWAEGRTVKEQRRD